MDKHISRSPGATGHPPRPSLYGSAPAARTEKQAFSILGGLEPNRSRWSLPGLKAWGASLLALAAAMLVIGLNSRNTDPPPPDIGKTHGPEAMEVQSAAAAPPESSMAPPVATIVSETALYVPEQHEKSGATALTGDDLPDRTADVAGSASSDPAMSGQAVAATVGEAARKRAPVQENAIMKSASPKRAGAATAAERANNTGGSRDRDVELIAALLSHVSPAPAPAKAGKAESAQAATRVATASPAPKRERGKTPNRDIVTKEASEPLESLVSRCRALGFFEGELCRLRICSGMWGTDPACPAGAPPGSG